MYIQKILNLCNKFFFYCLFFLSYGCICFASNFPNEFDVFTDFVVEDIKLDFIDDISLSLGNIFSAEYNAIHDIEIQFSSIFEGDLIFRKMLNEDVEGSKKKYYIDSGIILKDIFSDSFIVVYFDINSYIKIDNLSDFIHDASFDNEGAKLYSIMRFYDIDTIIKAVNNVKNLINNPYCKMYENFYVGKYNLPKPDYIDICKIDSKDFIISLFDEYDNENNESNEGSIENNLYDIKMLKVIDHIFYNKHILKLIGENVDIKFKNLEYRIALYNNDIENEDVKLNFNYEKLHYVYYNL